MGTGRQNRYVPLVSKRVRHVLHLVDELELDGDELRSLCHELDERQGCEVDLTECSTAEERELAMMLKCRIDAVARGETALVPMSDVMKQARGELRRIQGTRKPVRQACEGAAVPVRGFLLSDSR